MDIKRIDKNKLWKELSEEESIINAILFGGDRLSCVDEILAAYEDEKFIGVVTISPEGEMRDGNPAIVALFVRKEHRMKGNGTKLLECAIRRMIERGLIPVRVDVLSKGAKRVIEKLSEDLRNALKINDQSVYGP